MAPRLDLPSSLTGHLVKVSDRSDWVDGEDDEISDTRYLSERHITLVRLGIVQISEARLKLFDDYRIRRHAGKVRYEAGGHKEARGGRSGESISRRRQFSTFKGKKEHLPILSTIRAARMRATTIALCAGCCCQPRRSSGSSEPRARARALRRAHARQSLLCAPVALVALVFRPLEP